MQTVQMSMRIGKKLKSDLEKIAVMNRTTVTDIAIAAFTAYVQEHTADIERYNKVFEGR